MEPAPAASYGSSNLAAYRMPPAVYRLEDRQPVEPFGIECGKYQQISKLVAALTGKRVKQTKASQVLHPRDHIAAYVQPAVDMLDRDPLNRVLATNAILQIDLLVSLLADWACTNIQGATQEDAERFRNDLEDRRSDLVVVRKFRRMHESGELDVRFAAVRKRDRRLPVVMIPNGNGAYVELLPLLKRAMKCWGAELSKRGL